MTMHASPGFAAVTTVLIAMAVAVIVGTGLLIRAVGENQNLVVSEHSVRALMAANGCAERALMALKNSSNYAGNELLYNASGDSCAILPKEGSGSGPFIIKTTSTVANATRKLKIIISSLNPQILVSSWQEVVDY